MDSFSDKKSLMSDFNEAAYQIARLNFLWQNSANHAKNGDLYKYKWELDRIWIELSADAFQQNKDFYYRANNIHNKIIANSKSKEQLYTSLQEKEIFLKKLQEKVGKGSKKTAGYDGIME